MVTETCWWALVGSFWVRQLASDLPPGYAARIAALLPGPEPARRNAATFAWQDELPRELVTDRPA